MPVETEHRGNEKRIQHILILGGGSAGLMMAHMLQHQLPELTVSVIRSEALPPIGVGESTTPVIAEFVESFAGFDHKDFFARVHPTWKLGIRFDWLPEDHDPGYFYYPFDAKMVDEVQGLQHEVSFHHYWDGRVETPFTRMMDHRQAPMFMNPQKGLRVQRGAAYHIENRSFVRYLEEQAKNRGIGLYDRRFIDAEQDGIGDIICLIDDAGQRWEADLFVDASGFASRLLGAKLEEPFEPFDTSLFCDRAVTGSWERRDNVLPFTSADTMSAGWCWRVELADRVNRGYVFSSDFCDEESAIKELRERNPEMRDEDYRLLRFSPGRRTRCWVNNVFGIGNSAGFMEPLEATGLHMICVGARALIRSLKDSGFSPTPSMQALVNRFMGEIWDDIRDCLALHYKLNRRLHTPFWEMCRNDTDLGSAAGLLDFYRENGPCPFGEHLISRHSIFGLDGYYSLLIGLGAPSSFPHRRSKSTEKAWHNLKGKVLNGIGGALSNDESLKIVHARDAAIQ